MYISIYLLSTSIEVKITKVYSFGSHNFSSENILQRFLHSQKELMCTITSAAWIVMAKNLKEPKCSSTKS